MLQRFSSIPLFQANLNVNAHFFKDPYNKKLQRILSCRTNVHCHDGGEEKHKQGQLTFSLTCKARCCPGCAKCLGVMKRLVYLPSIMQLQAQALADSAANKVAGQARFYFVTLTQPTVFYDEINEQLDTINNEWRKLYNLSKKKWCKYYLSGLRTLEVEITPITPKMLTDRRGAYSKALKTNRVKKSQELAQLLHDKIAKIEQVQSYAFKLRDELKHIAKKGNIFDVNACDKELRMYWQNNAYKLFTYHPHMHLIVQGIENAKWIKKQWLRRFPDALSKAQKVLKIEDNFDMEEGGKKVDLKGNKTIAKMLYEVTKYVTKTIGSLATEKRHAHARALYWLHIKHLYKRKCFAAFGKVKKATEKQLENFVEEQKANGNFDLLERSEFTELERMVKRVAYELDESRSEWFGQSGKWRDKAKNYVRDIIDRETGEVTEIKLATKDEFDLDRDLTEKGKKLFGIEEKTT